jgi:membrane-associated phospholipid phosphatase
MRRPQSWVSVLAFATIATVISYLWIDRPFALFTHTNLHGYPIFDRMTLLTGWFPSIAIAVICFAGFAKYLGWRLPRVGEALLLCSVSLVVARAAKDQLKLVFGRTWPETWINNNPSLIRDNTFGFNPFHSGPGYESFPSGHSTGICAVIAVLWFYYPRFRALYVVPLLVIAAGLLGANYHFVSDIIAGCILGTVIAVFCMLLFLADRNHPLVGPDGKNPSDG